jgi:parvulin-like peptidyl-prolyl isomerase
MLAVAATASDAPLATVNGEPVTVKDLLEQFGSRHSGHSKFLGGEVEARKFLNIVIEDRLLVQEAYSLGLDEDAEVKKYVDEYEDSKVAQYFVSEEITKKAAATPEEAKRVWETSLGLVLHARQIVVPTRQEAEEIRTALLHGADFEALTRGCSIADSRLRGGHVMVSWGKFEPEWERVVFATEAGDVTPVIATNNGYEVVVVTNRIEVSPPDFDKVSKQLDDALFARKLEQRKQEISDELWRRHHVVLRAENWSPALIAKLLQVAPETVIATWDGGSLTLREAFTADEIAPLATLEPLVAKKEIAQRIRQTVNAPLVVLAAKERKMQEVPVVQADVDRYRDYVAESVLFRDHIFKKLDLTEEEIAQYYAEHPAEFEVPEQRRVAQILVHKEADAKALREKLVAGEDFAELAKKSSRDMVSAVGGGELGWIGADKVPPSFAEVLTLEVGAVSKPVQDEAGWHVIKVLETKAKSLPPLAEVQAQVRERALDAKKREARAFWVEKLRAASKIEIDDAAIAAFVKANEFNGKPPAQHAMQ